MATLPKLLSVAAANRRVAYVLFQGDQLIHWKISTKAGKSPVEAAGVTQSVINKLQPDVVVTQRIKPKMRKSQNTRLIMAAIARVASENYLLDVTVERVQAYANKYVEAIALAGKYPEITPWLPRARKLTDDHEPRNTILFEAIALGDQIISDVGNNIDLAIALG